MKPLFEFVSLRPIWTQRGLEVVWYAYLLGTLIQLGLSFRPMFSSNIDVSSGFPIFLIYSIIFAFAHLALVRIFLEFALKFIIPTHAEIDGPRP
jgi:hypothetical protein